MFEGRVAGLRQTVLELQIDPEYRDLLSRTLDLLRSAYTELDGSSRYFDVTGRIPPWEEYFTRSLEDFREALRAGDEHSLLSWAERALSSCVEAFQKDASLPDGQSSSLDSVFAVLLAMKDRVSLAVDLLSYSRRAEQTLASIEESQAKAQVAAGEIGGVSFVRHFAGHAKSQGNYAEVLRWLSVSLIAGVTAYAVLGNHPAENDWVGLISRGAVIAGVTAIAAYLARQSGQHRRASEWARSIEIQLRTFPAFVESVSEEDRSFVVRQMAARILASPPEKNSSSTDDSVSLAQVLDVVNGLAKRAP